MKWVLVIGSLITSAAAWSTASAQTYSKTETIDYYDDAALWVLGQVKRTTTNGIETSKTDYGWKALPWKTYAFGKLSQTLSYDSTSTIASGQLGTIKTVADGANHLTTISIWKRGIPQLIQYPATTDQPAGESQSAVVDDNGWIASVTDENGFKTCYGYDAMGRISQITYPSESAVNTCNNYTWAVTTQTFNDDTTAKYALPAGHWRQTVSTGSGRSVTFFDALWRPVVKEIYDNDDIAGTLSQVVTRYDSSGRVAFVSYPQRNLTPAVYNTWAAVVNPGALLGTKMTYDALDRVTTSTMDSEIGPLTTSTAYLNNVNGNYTRVINPGGLTTYTFYQAFDEPSYNSPVAISNSGGIYTDIVRDVFGKPTSITRRNNGGTVSSTRSYAYNANQELCRMIDPETGATDFGYDGAGNLTWSAAGLPSTIGCDADGVHSQITPRRVDRNYDARNRIMALVFPDHLGDTAYHYTPDSQLESVTADNGGANQVTHQYAYNRRRLMTQERELWGTIDWTIDNAFDANGHLSQQTYEGGLVVAYEPNALGQPTKAGTYATGVSYHPNGGIAGFTYGNGIVHTMTQNDRQLPERSVDFYGSSYKFIDDYYDYDGNGNVAAISDALPAHSGDRTMTYDELDRLRTVVSPIYGSTGAGYTYDVLDNLTRVKVGATPTAPARDHYYTYDASGHLTNVKTGGFNGTTVVGLGYDAQGNLANKNGVIYTFDYGNRLRGVTTSPGSSYIYDGHGRRVRDLIGASKYSQYSSGGQLMYVSDSRQNLRNWYIYLGGSLVAIRERDPTTGVVVNKYQHTDALGSPVAVTDQARTVLERSEFEPYGKLVNRPLTDGPGYTGHVSDAATGLDYMQQRYYDPGIGRFLSVDPVTANGNTGANFNRYWYANNNPYTNKDLDGRECNGRGCWVNPKEREAAASGNWREYYQLAGSSGDRYAQRAGEVASNTGSTQLNADLSAITNKFLADSIAKNMSLDPQRMTMDQRVAVEFKMEAIRVGLPKAHVQALDDAGASPNNPVSLDRAVIGEFHKEVFKANGADPGVFGGFKVDAAERVISLFGGTTRDVYDYCPKPSCSN